MLAVLAQIQVVLIQVACLFHTASEINANNLAALKW